MDNNFLDHRIDGYPIRINDVNNQIIFRTLNKGVERLNSAISQFDSNAMVRYRCSPSLSISSNRARWKLGLPKGGIVSVKANRPIVFPELRPNTCGILTCEIDSNASNKEILKQLNKSKRLFNEGVWDFGKSNHFVSLFESTTDERKYALIHGSEQDVKSDNDHRPGLYIENSNYWQERSVKVSTEQGSVRCLLDGDATLYWDTYLAAETKSKRARLETAVNIFGKINVLSDFVHVGMHKLGTINLGVNITSAEGAVFPLLTNFGENIYFVRPNDRSESGEEQIVPHSFGSTLKGFRAIKSITHDERGDLYELEHENGMTAIVRDFTELAFESLYRKELVDSNHHCFNKSLLIENELSPLLSIKL